MLPMAGRMLERLCNGMKTDRKLVRRETMNFLLFDNNESSWFDGDESVRLGGESADVVAKLYGIMAKVSIMAISIDEVYSL